MAPLGTRRNSACMACRERKAKCDQGQPSCIRCLKAGRPCPGYPKRIRWVPVKQLNAVDHLVAETAGERHQTTRLTEPPAKLERSSTATTASSSSSSDYPVSLDRVSSSRPSHLDIPRHPSFYESTASSTNSPTATPSSTSSLATQIHSNFYADYDGMSKRLLRYYISNVAPCMTPVKDARRSQEISYGIIEDKPQTVYQSLPSKDFPGSHDWRMRDGQVAAQNYQTRTASTHFLRIALDKADSAQLEDTLAMILSLRAGERSERTADQWHEYIAAGLRIAVSKLEETPSHLTSPTTWIPAQSLCAIQLRIRLDCPTHTESTGMARGYNPQRMRKERAFVDSIAGAGDFGFMVGAGNQLIECFIDSANLVDNCRVNGLKSSRRQQLEALSQRLRAFTVPIPMFEPDHSEIPDDVPPVTTLHQHIFALGLLICLHRRTTDPTPRSFFEYTISLFHGVAWYYAYADQADDDDLMNGPATWPVFYAATELYREEDQTRAREFWLDKLSDGCLGDRESIVSVVEACWAERSAKALKKARENAEPGQDSAEVVYAARCQAGDVVVDWTAAARSLGVDLFLI